MDISAGADPTWAVFEGEDIPRRWGGNRSHQSHAGIADPFVIPSSGLLPGAFGLLFPMGSASGSAHSSMVTASADVVVRSGHRIIDVQHGSRAVPISEAR